MNKILLTPLLAVFFLVGCANGQFSNTAGTDISNALSTVANVLQQGNNGLQTAAPSINTVLTTTHNQGDASAVNTVIAESAAAAPALQALLGVLDAAIKANTAPAAQVTAVNNALSPATINAIVTSVAPAN
jgi:hypothetical protein